MPDLDEHSANLFLNHLFSSKAAQKGHVIRRQLKDIDTLIGREMLMIELDRRGYQAVMNAGQLIIFCNQDPIQPLRTTFRARDHRFL